jgi:3'-phosphoadenosine 5'-phosphosulfate sulfotransferase (PAPS reductase)/FAD synthetase
MDEILDTIREELRELYLNDPRMLVVTWSGGKDSSLMLTLLWEAVESIPLELRTKTIHIICSDTGVETPAMTEYVHRNLIKIQKFADRGTKTSNGPLPFKVHLVSPKLKNSFWYKVFGRGTLVPTGNVRSRWCTGHLKITPSLQILNELVVNSPVQLGQEHNVILMLGVRDEESARRRASIRAHEVTPGSKWAKHSEINQIICYHPIKEVTSDEVFFALLDRGKLPYGLDVQEMTIQYGEAMLECGIKTSKNEQGASCGSAGSRSGCWTCGLSKPDDPMLIQLIKDGKEDYVHLLEWKKLMLKMRNDIRFREVLPRQQFNKKLKGLEVKRQNQNQIGFLDEMEEYKYTHYFESFQRANYEEYAPGAMTVMGRRILLEYLLYIQEQTGYTLIKEHEIDAILQCWYEIDKITVKREDLSPAPFDYDGELVFLPNKEVNEKLTLNPNPVFYITIDLNMEEAVLFEFLKERQQVTGKSYFFFPSAQEFKEHKVVWNKSTFVVCGKGIETQLKAAEEIYKWLGWKFGSFTEKTKKVAINFLILSALREGWTESQMKKYESLPAPDVMNLFEQSNGRFSLCI